MIDKTDFDKAFQSGYTFQYNQPYEGGIHDVTFSVHNIGELVVTSGKLVAADPSYWGYDEQGKLACLATDFILFQKENND